MVGRLERRSQFHRLRASSDRVRAGCLRVAYAPGDDPTDLAVGYAIPRRVGTAVRRNRVRRRLRAAVAHLEAEGRINPGWYLVTVRPMTTDPSYSKLTTWLGTAFDALGADVAGGGPGGGIPGGDR